MLKTFSTEVNSPSRRTLRRASGAGIVLAMVAGVLVACGGEEATPTPTPTGTPEPTPTVAPTPTVTPEPLDQPGQLALTFAMEVDYIPVMDEPPVGMFYGAIYRSGDVGSTGPKPGSESLEDIEVFVDLTANGGPTEVLYTTGPLNVSNVAILGFLDSDANDANDYDPDKKDPVTLPWDNGDFEVSANTTSTVQVFFGMLNP